MDELNNIKITIYLTYGQETNKTLHFYVISLINSNNKVEFQINQKSINEYIYIYIYIYEFTRVYIYKSVYIYIYIYKLSFTHTYTRTYNNLQRPNIANSNRTITDTNPGF